MSHFQGKNIVITGGSDGIGKALVQQFLGLGAKVATCGRNREKLKALGGITPKINYNDLVYIALRDFVNTAFCPLIFDIWDNK
jgi:NAD(P)-dependent dehydrogenase (short-subunit alcohol dehydrogenase family)